MAPFTASPALPTSTLTYARGHAEHLQPASHADARREGSANTTGASGPEGRAHQPGERRRRRQAASACWAKKVTCRREARPKNGRKSQDSCEPTRNCARSSSRAGDEPPRDRKPRAARSSSSPAGAPTGEPPPPRGRSCERARARGRRRAKRRAWQGPRGDEGGRNAIETGAIAPSTVDVTANERSMHYGGLPEREARSEEHRQHSAQADGAEASARQEAGELDRRVEGRSGARQIPNATP